MEKFGRGENMLGPRYLHIVWTDWRRIKGGRRGAEQSCARARLSQGGLYTVKPAQWGHGRFYLNGGMSSQVSKKNRSQ